MLKGMRQQTGSRYCRSRPHSRPEENINPSITRAESFEQSNGIFKKCPNPSENLDETADIERAKSFALAERRTRSERSDF